MTQKILEFEEAMRYNGLMGFEVNVPIGFVVSDSGKFILKYSLSETGRIFTKFEDLVDFVIEEYRQRYL